MKIVVNVLKVTGLFGACYAIVFTPYIADLVSMLLK